MASTPALVELTPDATENVLLNRDLFSKIGETCGTPFFASTYPVCKSWAVWVRELHRVLRLHGELGEGPLEGSGLLNYSDGELAVFPSGLGMIDGKPVEIISKQSGALVRQFGCDRSLSIALSVARSGDAVFINERSKDGPVLFKCSASSGKELASVKPAPAAERVTTPLVHDGLVYVAAEPPTHRPHVVMTIGEQARLLEEQGDAAYRGCSDHIYIYDTDLNLKTNFAPCSDLQLPPELAATYRSTIKVNAGRMTIVNSELIVSCHESAFPLAKSRCITQTLRHSFLVLTLQGEFKRRLPIEVSGGVAFINETRMVVACSGDDVDPLPGGTVKALHVFSLPHGAPLQVLKVEGLGYLRGGLCYDARTKLLYATRQAGMALRGMCQKCLLAKKMDDSPFAAMAGGLGCTPRCPMPSKLWVFSVA